ncbi:hypothetical protein FALBO_15993 [Fusarium albosuccineum]|uniref:Uncharacterized protein n=1 Tax=Fusarium albosuccineum TaxID=1237068 RepID=A0A8H4KQF9_9HYPO|nr:hypothetical protein FALBO_15993 [Fusarium albosuccineum]
MQPRQPEPRVRHFLFWVDAISRLPLTFIGKIRLHMSLHMNSMAHHLDANPVDAIIHDDIKQGMIPFKSGSMLAGGSAMDTRRWRKSAPIPASQHGNKQNGHGNVAEDVHHDHEYSASVTQIRRVY